MFGHSLGEIFTLVFLGAFVALVGGYVVIQFFQSLIERKWGLAGISLLGAVPVAGAAYGFASLWT